MSFLDLITGDLTGLPLGAGGDVVEPPDSASDSDKILFSWINHIDDTATVLTASQQVAGLGVNNVADDIVGRRWRAIGTSAYGQADFGSDKEVGIVALVFPRDTAFPTVGTIRHYFDADGGTPGTGMAHDSGTIVIGTVAGYGYHVYVPDDPFDARYWRWSYNVSGVSFVDIGRAWAGEAWQPNIGISFGHGEAWMDLSKVSASARSGAEFPDRRPRQRVYAFGLDLLNPESKNEIREMQRIVGLSEQMLVCRNPSDPAMETILCRISEILPITEPGLNIFSKAFRLRESL